MFRIKKIASSLIFLLLVVAIFLQVHGMESIAEENQPDPETQNAIHLVLVPEKNVFEQRRRYQFITDYLSQKMDMDFTIEIMSNYGDISEAFDTGEADAGFFGSFSYVLTHATTGIEPIVRPVWLNNNSTYRGYLFVRKDSNIESVKDMKDKSLVLVDKATTAGYIFPLFYFKYYGVDDLEKHFSKIYFASNHDAAAWAVYTGEADIGAAKDNIFNSLMQEYPDFKKQMVVLTESPEVPSNGLAVRQDLNPAIKVRMKTLLLSLHESPEGQQVLKDFGAIRFIETNNEDYRMLYNMVKQLGIDLHKYSYKQKSLSR
jgi:phosphonate transport system substrate-binding protein